MPFKNYFFKKNVFLIPSKHYHPMYSDVEILYHFNSEVASDNKKVSKDNSLVINVSSVINLLP